MARKGLTLKKKQNYSFSRFSIKRGLNEKVLKQRGFGNPSSSFENCSLKEK
jgi:hypothetical protein